MHLWEGAPRQWLLAALAGLSVWAWWRVALGPPPPLRLSLSKKKARAFGLFAGFVWTLVWLAMPVWALLKLVGVLMFAPVLAWRWHRAGRSLHSAGVWAGWALGLVAVAGSVLVSPWGLEPLLH